MTVLYGVPWLSVAVLLVVIGIILSITVDVIWGLLCLIVIFLLVPMSMSLLYYSYALRSPSYMNVLPHRLRFHEKGFFIEVFEKNKPKAKDEENEETIYELIYEKYFEYYEIGKRYIFPDGVAFKMIGKDSGFLWLEPYVFKSKDIFKDICHNLITL